MFNFGLAQGCVGNFGWKGRGAAQVLGPGEAEEEGTGDTALDSSVR